MSDRDLELRDFETRLADSRAEVDKMRIKADEAEADAKARYEAELDKIEREQQAAERKFEEMRRSDDASWQGLKGEFERALESLGDGLRRVREKLG